MPRDPYPFPKYENDNTFIGQRQTQIPVRDSTSRAQREEPWNRLYRTPTLASARREVFHHDAQIQSYKGLMKFTARRFVMSSQGDGDRAPNDDLDFVVKSKYDHHLEFLRSKAETLFQPETLGLPHGRILKNRPGPQEPEPDQNNLPLKISASNKRENIHSINGAIPSHHSAATNGGYSRKHDGGFYTC